MTSSTEFDRRINQALHHENKILIERMDSMRASCHAAYEKTASVGRELDKANQEIAGLRSDVRMAESEYEKCRDRVNEFRAENEALINEIEAIELENLKLQDLTARTRKHSALQKKALKIILSDEQVKVFFKLMDELSSMEG